MFSACPSPVFTLIAPYLVCQVFPGARRLPFLGRPPNVPFFGRPSRTHTPWFDCSPIVLMLLRVDGRVRPALIVAACLHAGTPGIRNERLPAACVADTAAVCTAIVQPTRQVGVRRVLPAKVHTTHNFANSFVKNLNLPIQIRSGVRNAAPSARTSNRCASAPTRSLGTNS